MKNRKQKQKQYREDGRKLVKMAQLQHEFYLRLSIYDLIQKSAERRAKWFEQIKKGDEERKKGDVNI